MHATTPRRVAVVSLVCRRWRDLCRGADLLACFEVNLWSPIGDAVLARLRSLAAWLVLYAGPHVRSLRLAIGLSGLECDEHSRAEAQALLGTCCNACPHVEVRDRGRRCGSRLACCGSMPHWHAAAGRPRPASSTRRPDLAVRQTSPQPPIPHPNL